MKILWILSKKNLFAIFTIALLALIFSAEEDPLSKLAYRPGDLVVIELRGKVFTVIIKTRDVSVPDENGNSVITYTDEDGNTFTDDQII